MSSSSTLVEKELRAPFTAFTAVPGQNDPGELSLRYQRRLAESLKVYLKRISESLHLTLTHQIETIGSLDPSKRFSPAIFAIYVRLRDAYPQNDIHGIFDVLQELRNLKEFYSIKLEYDTILTEAWEPPFIAHLRNREPRNEKGEVLTRPIRMLPLVHWERENYPPKEMQLAVDAIYQLDGGLRKEFETYVSKIKLFSGRVMEGVTSPRFFGNVYLRLAHPEEDPFLFYFEHLIHEASHLHLYAMMGEDPLVLNEESERFPSPLRADLRPMSGLFHAEFVLARIVRGLRKLCATSVNEGAALQLKHSEKLFRDGYETVDRYAKLTESGLAIFHSMEACAFG